MPSEGNRSITVVSSLFGQTGREGRLPYSLSKHALEGAAKTLAVELGPVGIRVNSISPGFIDTKLTRKNISQDQINKLEERIPLGTLGAPEDIADAIAFLISEKARYITGTNLTIDGGFMAGGFLRMTEEFAIDDIILKAELNPVKATSSSFKVQSVPFLQY